MRTMKQNSLNGSHTVHAHATSTVCSLRRLCVSIWAHAIPFVNCAKKYNKIRTRTSTFATIICWVLPWLAYENASKFQFINQCKLCAINESNNSTEGRTKWRWNKTATKCYFVNEKRIALSVATHKTLYIVQWIRRGRARETEREAHTDTHRDDWLVPMTACPPFDV